MDRRIEASFTHAAALVGAERQGVMLVFEPISARTTASLGASRIDAFADLGPDLTIPAVSGIGKVLRTLRAGRIAAPEPHALLGRAHQVAALLSRARTARVVLGLRARISTRFVAWTETGMEIIEDVGHVFEHPDAWIVTPRRGQPVRVPRAGVARQVTLAQRWWEVVAIERSTARGRV